MTQAPPNRSPFLPPLPPAPDPAPLMPEQRLSALLREIADDPARERISVADLMATMQLRAFGALLLIFALPNTVPAPPGTSAILGLPLVYLTWQLMLGRTPWLPRFINERSMTRRDFAALVAKISPLLERAERLLQQRLTQVTTPTAERAVGALCLILAVVLFLPIPLGNMLPAFAISLIALGILERDGLWIVVGAVLSLLSLLLVWGVIWAVAKTAVYLLLHAFAH